MNGAQIPKLDQLPCPQTDSEARAAKAAAQQAQQQQRLQQMAAAQAAAGEGTSVAPRQRPKAIGTPGGNGLGLAAPPARTPTPSGYESDDFACTR